jgi:hypothetical protein
MEISEYNSRHLDMNDGGLDGAVKWFKSSVMIDQQEEPMEVQ